MISAMFSDAMLLIVVMVTILVVPSLLVGLIVAVFQAATQINEQTLSFLPRLLATLFSLLLAGPWLLRMLVDFSERMLYQLPHLVH